MAPSAQLQRSKGRKTYKDRDKFAIRVRELATFVGGPGKLSERSGLSRAVIGKYLRGKSEPSRDRLVKLADAGGISVRWLATGEGEMCPEGDSYVRVPRYSFSAASGGGLQMTSEQIVNHLAFKAEWVKETLRADPKSLIQVEAAGDSMAPTILSDDLLLLEATDPPFKQDGVYAILRPTGLAIKRLVKRIDGSFEIRSDNPVYGSEIAPPEAIKIVGRVIWFGRRP